MSDRDPFDELIRAEKLYHELDGKDAQEIDEALLGREDLRDLVSPLLAKELPSDPIEARRCIGDFELLREVGRGGMGIVYEARDAALDRRVALKLLSPALQSDTASIARFRREATLAAGLEHPSLARVYGLNEGVDGHYLLMEFVEGTPLDAFIAEAVVLAAEEGDDQSLEFESLGLSIPEGGYEKFVAARMAEVAEALDHAHRAGIIHRDVKPGNIILRRKDGRAVLTDFGLARHAGRQGVTMTGELSGTPAYQSPEQVVVSSHELGPSTDVFSLGVTLYELLTLRKPFDAETVLEIQQQILRKQPPHPSALNPDISRDLSLIIAKCLEKRPGDRFKSASALAADLRRYNDSDPIMARRLSFPLRVSRWCALNPWLAAFILFLCICAASMGALFVSATNALSNYQRLAVGLKVKELRDAHDAAPPAWPEHMGLYGDLIKEAERLSEDLPMLQRSVEQLRANGFPDPANPTELKFENIELKFLYEGNLGNLDLLRDVESRVLPNLRAQLDWAGSIKALSLSDHKERWAQVAAQLKEDSRFGGFSLRPQMGLVPLSLNRESGLWEFAHLRSGDLPKRGDSGDWKMLESTGMVFVLVPPGSFMMGCQAKSVDAPNYFDAARAREGPVHEVSLSHPFFLSKYELTRGQWERLGGELAINDAVDTHDQQALGRYPLMGQSFDEVQHRLARHGLVIPTESQWEYSCRAGAQTPWSCGGPDKDLVQHANIRDLDLYDERESVGPPKTPKYAQARDGFARQAPVGSFAPNAFGLHDMHGNVNELCRDWLRLTYDSGEPPQEPDGLRGGKPSSVRSVRGGSYLRDLFKTASGIRNAVPPGARNRAIGVRPARVVLP